MFSTQGQIRSFINGNTFVTEERPVREEVSTRTNINIPIFEIGIAGSKAEIKNGGLTESTIPEIKIAKNTTILKNVSKILSQIRKDFAFSQEDCAKLVGLSIGTIQNYENEPLQAHRDTVIKIHTLIELSKFLKSHISQSYILRSLMHAKMGLFGNRSALEFAEKLPNEKRIFEVFALYRKIYE